MISRVKQNRAQRPSNRSKFKENNREPIYSSNITTEKPNFKKFPDKELKKVKTGIRKKAELKKRKEQRIFRVFLVFSLFVLIGVLVWLN